MLTPWRRRVMVWMKVIKNECDNDNDEDNDVEEKEEGDDDNLLYFFLCQIPHCVRCVPSCMATHTNQRLEPSIARSVVVGLSMTNIAVLVSKLSGHATVH